MYVSTEVSECTLAFQAQIGRAVILDWGMWHLCYLCSAPVFIVFVGHMSTLIAGPELRSMLAVYGTMDFFKPQPRLKCQKTCTLLSISCTCKYDGVNLLICDGVGAY